MFAYHGGVIWLVIKVHTFKIPAAVQPYRALYLIFWVKYSHHENNAFFFLVVSLVLSNCARIK